MKKVIATLIILLVTVATVAFVNPLHQIGDPDCWTQVDEQEYCSCTYNEEEEEDPAPLSGNVVIRILLLKKK